jgi:hypothetical protein
LSRNPEKINPEKKSGKKNPEKINPEKEKSGKGKIWKRKNPEKEKSGKNLFKIFSS